MVVYMELMLKIMHNIPVEHGRYIDVIKMVNTYRSKIFSKINVFSIQTAGYTNVVIPEYAYRTNVMYGWTGKEAIFADAMIRFWNQKELNQKNLI